MKQIHPLLRILGLLELAVMVQFLSVTALAALSGGIALLAYLRYQPLCRLMLRRTRWLLVTMWLIFTFSTPGEYVPGWPMWLSPTYEGMISGGSQMLRLLAMLTGLVLLLGSTPREELMSALYQLMRPLRGMGASPQRFAARLWLTLEYLEHPQFGRRSAYQSLPLMLQDDSFVLEKEKIAIEIVPFRPIDWTLAMMMTLICVAGAS